MARRGAPVRGRAAARTPLRSAPRHDRRGRWRSGAQDLRRPLVKELECDRVTRPDRGLEVLLGVADIGLKKPGTGGCSEWVSRPVTSNSRIFHRAVRIRAGPIAPSPGPGSVLPCQAVHVEDLPSCAAEGNVQYPVLLAGVARIAVPWIGQQDAIELQALRPVDRRHDDR